MSNSISSIIQTSILRVKYLDGILQSISNAPIRAKAPLTSGLVKNNSIFFINYSQGYIGFIIDSIKSFSSSERLYLA